MAKFIRTISDDSFRLQVKHLTTAKVFELRARADLLLVYLDNPDQAARAHQDAINASLIVKRRRVYW